jgi:hypothetical protein
VLLACVVLIDLAIYLRLQEKIMIRVIGLLPDTDGYIFCSMG